MATEAQTDRTDVELVAAAAGNPEAFAPIVDRYRGAVFGVALARLRDFHAAEDVAQDVFVRAFERLGGLRNPARLAAWLRTMTIRRCADHYRRRADGEELTTAPASRECDPAVTAQRRELRQAVLDAISRLTKVHRETVTLYYIDGYSVAQVAGMLEVPTGTVKGRLHDARADLKREMMTMVEEVLKSEGPGEEFTQRVLELLDGPPANVPWGPLAAELREIGDKGIEGFEQALSVHSSRKRAFAATMIRKSGQGGPRITAALLASLSDSNKHVRRHAASGLLAMPDVTDEQKRTEVVPRVVELLFDKSGTVRHKIAGMLRRWAASVPIATAAEALVAETDPRCRLAKERLLRAVVKASKAERE